MKRRLFPHGGVARRCHRASYVASSRLALRKKSIRFILSRYFGSRPLGALKEVRTIGAAVVSAGHAGRARPVRHRGTRRPSGIRRPSSSCGMHLHQTGPRVIVNSDVSHFPASAADGVASVAGDAVARSLDASALHSRAPYTSPDIRWTGPQAQQQKSPACAGLSGTTGLDQADLRRRAAKPIPTRPKPISASVAGSGICLVNEPSLCV